MNHDAIPHLKKIKQKIHSQNDTTLLLTPICCLRSAGSSLLIQSGTNWPSGLNFIEGSCFSLEMVHKMDKKTINHIRDINFINILLTSIFYQRRDFFFFFLSSSLSVGTHKSDRRALHA